jgi:hypothetical protein
MMRALLCFNAAAVMLRGRDLFHAVRRAHHQSADVPECLPFRGGYVSGCELVHNMCELSSYTDDPSNPSWCTQYNRKVLTAWKDCEMDVRLNDTDSQYGPQFVRCFTSKTEPPNCNGICEHHAGACQILCPAMAECYTLCRDENADRGGPVRDRYDMMNCMNLCLMEKPTPPPANEFWPDTKNASLPPEAVAHQKAMAADAEWLAEAEANLTAQHAKLEAASAAQDAAKEELKKLLKMAMGLEPIPTQAPAPPTPAKTTNATNATAPAPVAPPVVVEETTTAAPVPVEDAVANSPILKSKQLVSEETKHAEEQTAAVEAETAKLHQQVADLRAQLGLPPVVSAVATG